MLGCLGSGNPSTKPKEKDSSTRNTIKGRAATLGSGHMLSDTYIYEVKCIWLLSIGGRRVRAAAAEASPSQSMMNWFYISFYRSWPTNRCWMMYIYIYIHVFYLYIFDYSLLFPNRSVECDIIAFAYGLLSAELQIGICLLIWINWRSQLNVGQRKYNNEIKVSVMTFEVFFFCGIVWNLIPSIMKLNGFPFYFKIIYVRDITPNILIF